LPREQDKCRPMLVEPKRPIIRSSRHALPLEPDVSLSSRRRQERILSKAGSE
jgi:hypothetical protein